MEKNLGPLDRTVRIILGVIAVAIGYHYESYWGLVGLLPLATGLPGFCPAYCPLGLKTCRDSCRRR